ncbi:putative Heat shock protein Hsp90 family [Helianthus debilis subsp. tardiflorus]
MSSYMFAHPKRVERLVKNYSQFVSFAIYTWQEKGYTKEVEVDEDRAEAKKDGTDDNVEVSGDGYRSRRRR